MNNIQEIHEKIFEQKEKLNVSNYRIAKLSGLNRQLIDSFEKNYQYNLKIQNIIKMCNALSLKINLENEANQ